MTQTIRVNSSGSPIIGSGGGGGPSYVPTVVAGLSANYEVANPSGSTVAAGTKWNFGMVFPAGDVPAGNKVVLKVGGTELTTYQYGEERTHDDGSLQSATFHIETDAAINNGATQTIALSAEAGSPNQTSSISDSTITTNCDFRVQWKDNTSTLYYSDFNDGSGSWNEIAAGPLCRILQWNERTHTSVPAAHARVWANWYVIFYNDNTWRVHVELVNGYAGETCTNYIDLEEVTLKDGATTLRSETGAPLIGNFGSLSKIVVADTNGIEHWGGGHSEPGLTHKHDISYLADSNIIPRVVTSKLASLVIPSHVAHYNAYDADKECWPQDGSGGVSDWRSTGSTGGNPWIGNIATFNMQWLTLQSGSNYSDMRTSYVLNRRMNAAYGAAQWTCYESDFTMPNYISGIQTFTGMTNRGTERTHQTYGWRNNQVGTMGWGGSLSAQDGDHNPQLAFLFAMLDGLPWFKADQQLQANWLVGWYETSEREWTLDGTTYYGYFPHPSAGTRSGAWTYREIFLAALASPDADTHHAYFEKLHSDYNVALYKWNTSTEANGSKNDEWKGIARLEREITVGRDNEFSPWGDYFWHSVMAWAAAVGMPNAVTCATEYNMKFPMAWAEAGPRRMSTYRASGWNSDTTNSYEDINDLWVGQAWPPDKTMGADVAIMELTGVSGTFQVGETVTGRTSTHTAKVLSINASTDLAMLAVNINGFTLSEIVDGDTSGASGTFNVRTYLGYPAVPDSTKRVGDPSPTLSFLPSGDSIGGGMYYICHILFGFAYMAEYMTGANQTNAKAYWDQAWSDIDGSITDAHKMRGDGGTGYIGFLVKYKGATE